MADEPKTPNQESTEAPVNDLFFYESEADQAEGHKTGGTEEANSEEAKTEEATEESKETEETSKTEETSEEEASETKEATSIEEYDWGGDWKTIKVPVKVDGQPAEAKIEDLIKTYQLGQATEKRLEEAKTVKAQAQQEYEAKQQELHGKYATVAKLIEKAETLLDQDVSRIDWARLRDDDPAEYSAKKTEVSERRQEIEKMKREAVDSYQQSTAEQQKQNQERIREIVKAEQVALLEKLPEWRDETVAKTEKTKIVNYLKSQGFDDQDILSAVDHKVILVARKAMLYDEGQTKVSAAKKKLAKVPKVMKPGAPKPKPQPKSDVEILYGATG